MRFIDTEWLLSLAATSVPIAALAWAMMADDARPNSRGATDLQIMSAEIVDRLNGDILWAPATASTDVVTRMGDEARSVFGPIPDIDCGDASAKTIPLEIDGNIVDLKPNPGKAGHPLEFEHRDISGAVVKWTSEIAACDKPSLAGNVTYCGMNSRVTRKVKGSVEWVALCRKSRANLEIDPEPYWQESDPTFARLGIIGFNRLTGEIVFFDGANDRHSFDWRKPFVPPGGHSYFDQEGRAAASVLYDPGFEIQCSACHDNKSPYVISPHIAQARIGYRDGATGAAARAFSLGDYLPRTPHSEDLPFRVIGSAYTAIYGNDLARAQTVRDPSGTCTECHTLTTGMTGQRLAADAAGRDPFVAEPDWTQLVRLRAEQTKLDQIAGHRTRWATRAGAGGIHPWMVPKEGGKVASAPSQITESDWQALSNCLWQAGGAECGYRPLYTPCPPPADPFGDSAQPSALTATIGPPAPGAIGADRLLSIGWSYLNDYGHVPERDDVRFNLVVRSSPVPASSDPPAQADYPTVAQARGDAFVPFSGEVGASGDAILIRDIAYTGHRRFTDPMPSTTPRPYRIDLPVQCNRRYLARLLPKRSCFDQTGTRYADKAIPIYADIACN
ncbi:hypothetical protein QTL95_06890 [Rhizobium sp. S152]|uniref:hypothetical protein n=1 Tax=Rhizobium sp. S152 TaxID=3055038 RepID=UPI0025AA12D2|nr:hypothetical protein [Rhizobium sp. S152]MDM9625613.1 hypothetical protein [Rhizobium sp. S152]